MLGYIELPYKNIGLVPAKMDDVLNYHPCAALGAFPAGGGRAAAVWTSKNGWRIWRRDRRKHASPNSAQTESVCAGLLGAAAGGRCVVPRRAAQKGRTSATRCGRSNTRTSRARGGCSTRRRRSRSFRLRRGQSRFLLSELLNAVRYAKPPRRGRLRHGDVRLDFSADTSTPSARRRACSRPSPERCPQVRPLPRPLLPRAVRRHRRARRACRRNAFSAAAGAAELIYAYCRRACGRTARRRARADVCGIQRSQLARIGLRAWRAIRSRRAPDFAPDGGILGFSAGDGRPEVLFPLQRRITPPDGPSADGALLKAILALCEKLGHVPFRGRVLSRSDGRRRER